MQLKSGTLLQGGKYRIGSVLGQGGFGITYMADQPDLKRKVAIKEFFMRDFCNRDDDTSHVSVPSVGSKGLVEKFKTKFIKEAQTIAEYRHPNIVQIHDVFKENDTAYYVMEYHGGGSLSSLPLPLPVDQACVYVRQIASALSVLHENRTMHLDIKPSNVLLDKSGNAVLIDFGVSKHYDEAGHQASSTPVALSHGYAPGEQYQPTTLVFSPATDIYALGATFYKLVTGETPPHQNEVSENGLPPFPDTVPAGVVSVIEKAMQSRRKDRPQSVGEFLALLDAALEEPVADAGEDDVDETDVVANDVVSPVPSAPSKPSEPSVHSDSPEPPSSGRRRLWWLWVLILGVIAGVVSYFVFSSGEDEGPSVSGVEQPAPSPVPPVKPVDVPQTKPTDPVKPVAPGGNQGEDISYSNGVLNVKGYEYPMVYVSGGTFMMGSDDADADSDEEVHKVTLSGYRIGKYEVTQGMWKAVMGNNPSHFTGDDNLPVECVSWNDCQAFLRALNKETGQNFKLPTEAQWEFAARGGNSSNGTKYSGSTTLSDVGWYSDNSGGKTHKVGEKKNGGNELGVYDMSGNVWEWCRDLYDSDYYKKSPASNPCNVSSGSNRVGRGGSWCSGARYCRVSFRYYDSPDYRNSFLGFRLCL